MGRQPGKLSTIQTGQPAVDRALRQIADGVNAVFGEATVLALRDWRIAESTGTPRQLLIQYRASGETWTTVFSLNLVAALKKGDLLYASADGVLSRLPIGTVGQKLTVDASGVPKWV